MPWGMWPEKDLTYFSNQKNIFWGSRKSIWGPKRGLKGQFDVKKANFRGLIAKNGYLRPIITSRTNL